MRYACINCSSFLSIWGVDPTSDSADIQPTHFCHSCYVTASRFASSLKKTKRTPVDWLSHNSTSCTVCDVHCKGGRPKKKHSTGRPTLLSMHINAVAGDMPQFTLSQLADERYKEDVTSKSCSCAANNPVEILLVKHYSVVTVSLQLQLHHLSPVQVALVSMNPSPTHSPSHPV